MTKADPIVFVLGAGFTKAFLPDAPLLSEVLTVTDIEELLKEFEGLRYTQRTIRAEVERERGGVNLERLLTRLEGRMPYDMAPKAYEEFPIVASALKKRLVDKLENAWKGTFYTDDLVKFAKYCLDHKASCATFNYDDALDRTLWQVANNAWDPNSGYGFFCEPSDACIGNNVYRLLDIEVLVLKLHGSVNWRARWGESKPYRLGAIVHHSGWLEPWRPDEKQAIERHLEPDSFVVAPTLEKSSLVSEPVLRLVWERAFEELSHAKSVVFIGYSLPLTDLAAQYLFQEALFGFERDHLWVVTKADGPERDELVRRYCDLFPGLPDSQFYFDGAREWVRTALV